MKKTTCLVLLLTCFACCLHAEEYTIWFKSANIEDGTTRKYTLEEIISTSTDDCVERILNAELVYAAKPTFGIKIGKQDEKGNLMIGLNEAYNIQDLTIYAAAFGGNNKDSINPICVCGDTIQWEKGYATQIYPYTIHALGMTDCITLAALTNKNNRFYVQKIVFTAEDPYPLRAKITAPSGINFNGVTFYKQYATQDTTIQIKARSTMTDLDLELMPLVVPAEEYTIKYNDTIFRVTPSTLSPTGGEVTVSYLIKSRDASIDGEYLTDTLKIIAIGQDYNTVTKSVPLQVWAKGTKVDFDTTHMQFGPMPCHYYNEVQGKHDEDLMNTLSSIMKCGHRYTYGSGNHSTWCCFFYTDRDTLTNQVFDMYSDSIRYFDAQDTCASVKGCDIEHMLPNSWWGGQKGCKRAYRDLFALVPADYSANRSKNDIPPGIPADTTFNNGTFVIGSGSNYGLTCRVFCPADEYKGDFARAWFYIATCYKEIQWKTTDECGQAMTNNDYHEFQPWLMDVLMSWHRMDPVSQHELDRAIAVNQLQGNRNPFIDYPELAEYIWGNKQGQKVDFNQLTQSFGDDYCDGPAADRIIRVPANAEFKVLKNGQVIIQINGHTYTVLGFAADK